MTRVFLGLGSNVDAEKNLTHAAKLLRGLWPDVVFSSVYSSAPRDHEDQPEFLNVVATFECDISAEDLEKKLQAIEQELKKDPPFRFGPRTIDIDILLYDHEIIEEEGLSIPHARMHERRFVLEPLCEILNPQTKHPVLEKSFESLLEETLDQSCDLTEIDL